MLIVLSSQLASYGPSVILSTINFLGILLLPVFIPAIQFGNLAVPLIYNGVMSALILVMTQHRNGVERDRLAEMAQINSALQTSNATLQTSNAALADRTKALATSTEVSRHLFRDFGRKTIGSRSGGARLRIPSTITTLRFTFLMKSAEI